MQEMVLQNGLSVLVLRQTDFIGETEKRENFNQSVLLKTKASVSLFLV